MSDVPQPGRPVLNLTTTTWGLDGPETRRSRTASATLVPVLGYPDPNPFERFRLFVHAFGTVLDSTRRRTVLALCRVTVREPHGEFDPDDPKACPDCAEFVRGGPTFEQASVTNERMTARMADPRVIVCRRG